MRGRSERGFTLMEVLLALAILASATIFAMTSMAGAVDRVMDTIEQRKMRHLTQMLLSDVIKGKMVPDDPEEDELYEEGAHGDFRDFAVDDEQMADFEDYRWEIPVFRDEIIIGGADEETLMDMGFVTGESGSAGRPVSNDSRVGEGAEEEQGAPPGQVKRVLVFVVRRLAASEDQDRQYVLMTYLPFPGEEEQEMGGEGEAAPGGLGAPGGGPPGTPASTGSASGGQKTDGR